MFHLSRTERVYTNKIIKDITCNSKCPSLYLRLTLCFQTFHFKRAPLRKDCQRPAVFETLRYGEHNFFGKKKNRLNDMQAKRDQFKSN